MDQSELAIEGGKAVFPDGPPSWPIADEQILHNIQTAIADGSWGEYDGRWTQQLVEELAKLTMCEHVLLCSSGTIAVEIALRAVDAQPNSEVILAAYDYPGNFRSIESVGARPVLVDVVENGWVIDPDEIEAAITADTSAVIVSHLHGQLADCQRIFDICKAHDIYLIEDVCQMPGGKLDARPLGSFGHVSVFSFGGSKLLSAGRGGAVVTNDAEHNQRARIFCNRGNDAFPLSQLQASVLLPQFGLLAERNRLRLERVEQLQQATQGIFVLKEMRQTMTDRELIPAFYKLPWLIDDAQGDWTRSEFINAIRAEGVAIDIGFRGFTRRSAKRCRHQGPLINSRIAAQQTIVLHHPILLESETVVQQVALALEKVGKSRG